MNQQDVLTFTSRNGDYEVLVKTDSISYAWCNFKSRISYRNCLADEPSDPMHYCRYDCKGGCDIAVLNPDGGSVVKTNGKEELWPVVFETNRYQICIKLHDIDPSFDPRVVHINKEVQDAFFLDHEKDEREMRMTGSVDFLNQPGLFRLSFEYKKNGQIRHEYVAFDVVSPKLDIKHDYKRILDDVNQEFEGIVFDYLSTTFQQFGRGKEKNLQVWMQVFEQVVQDYLKNIDRVIKSPNSRMRTIDHFAKADRVKHWLPQLEEEYKEVEAAGGLESHYFNEQVYDNTINTFENRFVKHTLKSIGGTLLEVFDKLLKSNSSVSEEYRENWAAYQTKIKHLQKHPFFKSVGKFEGMNKVGMVLQSRKGYQQIYRAWLKLRRGIDFYNGATNIGTMQIWEIYELWCFLKMKRMVRELMGFDPSKPDSAYEGLITEPKGHLIVSGERKKTDYSVRFKYPNPDNLEGCSDELAASLNKHQGDEVVLHYQHTFDRRNTDEYQFQTLTTEQRPDIVLNIVSPDIVLTYLYDAKYRVWSDKSLDREIEEADIEEMRRIIQEDNTGLTEEMKLRGADYPPSDAINQMHRYRDAIYYGMKDNVRPESKEIIGGYILFPGRGDDESIARRYYSRSIKSVNIGAFPLLPVKGEKDGSGRDVEGPQLWDHLKDVLRDRERPVAHVKDSVPQRGLYYTEHNPADDLCLVVNDQNHAETAEKIIAVGRYGIGLMDKDGALALAEGFTNVKHLVLHKQKEPIVFEVTSAPRLLTRSQIVDGGIPAKYNGKEKRMQAELFMVWNVNAVREEDIEQSIDSTRLSKREDGGSSRETWVVSLKQISWVQ